MEYKIDFTQPEKYHLLIRLHWPNRVSFYVYSDKKPDDGLYFPVSPAASSLTDSLKDAVYADKRLSLNYNKVYVLVVNGLYTFVPDSVYLENEDKKELFLKFNFENIEKNAILTNKIDVCKIMNLFGIQKDLFDFLQRTFSNVEYVHHITPLMHYFLKIRTIGENARVYVHLTNSDVSVFCFRSNRVEAVNTFSYSAGTGAKRSNAADRGRFGAHWRIFSAGWFTGNGRTDFQSACPYGKTPRGNWNDRTHRRSHVCHCGGIGTIRGQIPPERTVPTSPHANFQSGGQAYAKLV